MKLTNNPKREIAENFLARKIAEYNYNWDPSKMKLTDGVLYANAKISVGGTQPLLTGDTREIRGITNFNGNMLAKGRVFVMDSIAFGVVEADADKLEHEVEYNYNEIPSYLNYAHLVLKQKDEIIVNMPISAIVNDDKDTIYNVLSSLELIEDDTITELDIQFPLKFQHKIPVGKALFVSAFFGGMNTFLKR